MEAAGEGEFGDVRFAGAYLVEDVLDALVIDEAAEIDIQRSMNWREGQLRLLLSA